MARKLAHNAEQSGISADERNKVHLNRREYLRLGAAAAAVTVGVGTSLAEASSDETFTTDFSEYAS